MNVTELIARLKTFPPDSRVIVQGYEAGFDDVLQVSETAIVADAGLILDPPGGIIKGPNRPIDYGWGVHSKADAKHPATETAVWIKGDRKL